MNTIDVSVCHVADCLIVAVPQEVFSIIDTYLVTFEEKNAHLLMAESTHSHGTMRWIIENDIWIDVYLRECFARASELKNYDLCDLMIEEGAIVCSREFVLQIIEDNSEAELDYMIHSKLWERETMNEFLIAAARPCREKCFQLVYMAHDEIIDDYVVYQCRKTTFALETLLQEYRGSSFYREAILEEAAWKGDIYIAEMLINYGTDAANIPSLKLLKRENPIVYYHIFPYI